MKNNKECDFSGMKKKDCFCCASGQKNEMDEFEKYVENCEKEANDAEATATMISWQNYYCGCKDSARRLRKRYISLKPKLAEKSLNNLNKTTLKTVSEADVEKVAKWIWDFNARVVHSMEKDGHKTNFPQYSQVWDEGKETQRGMARSLLSSLNLKSEAEAREALLHKLHDEHKIVCDEPACDECCDKMIISMDELMQKEEQAREEERKRIQKKFFRLYAGKEGTMPIIFAEFFALENLRNAKVPTFADTPKGRVEQEKIPCPKGHVLTNKNLSKEE